MEDREMNKLIACAVAAVPAAAFGGITFTFDDPGSGAEFVHLGPTMGNPVGAVSFRNDLPVDLEIRDDAALPTDPALATFSAFFEVDWQVGSIFTGAGDAVQSATLSGTFQWVDAGSGDVILSGAFTEAAIVTFGIAGSIVTSSDIVGGQLAYTVGQPLIDLGIDTLIDPQDAVWTLTDLAAAGAGAPPIVEIDGERFFNTFTANAAFTGTAEIPTPGAMAIAAAAGIAGLRRRR